MNPDEGIETGTWPLYPALVLRSKNVNPDEGIETRRKHAIDVAVNGSKNVNPDEGIETGCVRFVALMKCQIEERESR